MGRSSREVSGWTGPIRATSAALSLDVYAGSAGIALFLAQLHALTGDTWALKTSLGTIRRSIRLLDRAPAMQDLSPLSFYCGHLGIAFVARRVGTMTGVEKLIRQADSILEGMARATSSEHVLDVIGGNAGAIPALLTFGHSCGLETLRDLAIALGDELLRAAVCGKASCYWQPDLASGPGTGAAPLTGLSHGASGMGLALFELYALTGRLEFLETARGAFGYEDSLFDANERNWPDLRFSADQTHFARLWCHGAPGIALARLRAATLDPDRAKNYLEFARIALATTIRAIEENLAEPRPDASLCHGMVGLGEVCLFASQALNDPSYREVADSLAVELISRYSATGDWPSGAPSGGPNPSLMLGLAGIGYWFLRLHDMEHVASVLLVTP
jgi:lantibiotic biosynthesis protein